MAELPPSWMTGCYSPQGDRLMLGNIVCGEGVADVVGGSLLVTTGGSGLDLSVAQGGAWVDGDDDDRGTYSVYNDAPVTVTAGANASGNPRIDTVVARVYDSVYGEGADEWKLEILPGTATGGATLANLTGKADLTGLNAIPLAYVLVPNGFAGPFVDATNILDARQPFLTCDGQWADYTPTLTGVTGTFQRARWIESNGVIHVQLFLQFTGAPSGPVIIGVPKPFAYTAGSLPLGSCFIYDSSASALFAALPIVFSTATLNVVYDDHTAGWSTVTSGQGWVSGDYISMTITYEPLRV